VLWGWLGEPLDEDDLATLERIRTALRGQLGDTLAPHLTDEEIDAAFARCRRLADRAVMPAPRGSYPAIPWPPF
jgi:hypothetical protein